ncbi:hypothetical protein KNJ79_06625 [Sphingopyxis indica]|uniref:hypothetical protein n=1 Tax=Sphingopyxis indica TaxID=436663 RepID=UPI00293944BC|nr:hypothetical protein [Sphingopyxis indica]WOF44588.1 hypothetical protein KNJ79_06625 [Sphingopyxis indica]
MIRYIASFVLFAALLGLTIFTFADRRGERIAAKPGWDLAGVTNVEIPPETAEKAKAVLARQPLNQPVLNLLFAIEARGNLAPDRRKRFIQTLEELGWRDTAAQQNLIIETLRDAAPREAVRRADALLRREKLIPNVITILSRIEIYPEAADLLIERLSLRPPWRDSYFGFSGTLRSQDALDARIRLFDKMLAKGMTLTRSDLKASLDAMVRAGMQGEAVRIAMAANPAGAGQSAIYDPDFAKFVALAPRDRDKPLPFEWTVISRPGISTMIVPRGKTGQLQIRWNGVGAPVVANTMTMLKEGDMARLDVGVDGVDALTGLESFTFGLACRGKGAVSFEEGQPLKDNVAHFVAREAAMCDYPELVMYGRPQAADRQAETAIDAIRLSTS